MDPESHPLVMRGPLLVALCLLLAGCATPGADDRLDADVPASGGGDGDGNATAGPGSGGPGGSSGSGGGGAGGGTVVGGNVSVGGGVNATTNATGPPDWGEPDGHGIRPGINMEFQGAGCTTSFVLHLNWTRYFLATAAHCVEDGSSDDTNGCTAPLSDGTKARLLLEGGGTATATIAYTSWDTMQRLGGAGDDACRGNDFALLEVAPLDLDELHPASLHFEAPTGLAERPTPTVYGYGASSLKGGVEEVHPKEGRHLGMANGGWSHHVYLASPGIPGDSGGHIMTSDGKALGVASTILLAPTPASNHYTDLARALAYMEEKEGWAPELVTWDGWDPSLV